MGISFDLGRGIKEGLRKGHLVLTDEEELMMYTRSRLSTYKAPSQEGTWKICRGERSGE